MFGFQLRFSGSADRMALFRVPSNPRWRLSPTFAACILRIDEKLQRHRAVSLRHHGFLVKLYGSKAIERG